jgi:hypothetical protein
VRFREFADWGFAAREAFDDGAARGVCEGVEDAVQGGGMVKHVIECAMSPRNSQAFT